MLRKNVELRAHQKEAVGRLSKANGSLLLAHDVGTGKTLTALAGFEQLKKEGKASRTLIVTPASLRENFATGGIKKFTTDKYIVFGNEAENKADPKKFTDPDEYANIMDKATHHVVSYDRYLQDPMKYLRVSGADTVIYDEIHRARNEYTNLAKVMKTVRPMHKNFIGLTGSMVSNSPSDIVPLIDALSNGHHGLGTKEQFEKKFVRVDQQGNKHLLQPNLVKGIMAPFVHVASSEHMATEPPPKTEIKEIPIEMSAYQTQLYQYSLDKLDPMSKRKIRFGLGKLSDPGMRGIFAKLITARQVSNSIHTMDPKISLSESAHQTPKARQLLDDVEKYLAEVPDAQILITTNLIHGGVDVLSQGMKDRNISFGAFIGKGNKGVTEEERQQAVALYNTGKHRVLLISSAGGEGLNLPNTTHILDFDGFFNPEKINQQEGRGIRAGGLSHRPEKDRKVLINRYVSIPARQESQIAWNLAKSINPLTYLGGGKGDDRMFSNPFQRTLSIDREVYRIARQKAVGNAELKGLLDKPIGNVYNKP